MEIINAAGRIKQKIKIKSSSSCGSNFAFRAHFMATVTILITCAAFTTMHSLIGKPIQCIGEFVTRVNIKSANIYCYISATFSLPKSYHKPLEEVVYPGLGPHKEGDDVVYHSYYLWVPFMLVLQAVTFYLPRLFWKLIEHGKINNLLAGYCGTVIRRSNDRKFIRDEKGDEVDKPRPERRLAKYLNDHLYTHRWYFFAYVLCEILNFVITVSNIAATDSFLGGEFSKYGLKVIDFMREEPENRTDPMSIVFPTVTKCSFKTYGFSGTVMKYDYLCVLAQNIINEKIYFFIYIWFFFLAFVGASALLYRLLTIVIRPLRLWLLKRECLEGMRVKKCSVCECSLPALDCRGNCTIPADHELDFILRRCDIADWFLLHEMARCLDRLYFTRLMYSLSLKMKEERPNGLNDYEEEDTV